MGRIVSPAGDVAFIMEGFKRKGTDIVIVGKMGLWESEIYLSYKETLGFLFNGSLWATIIILPFAIIRDLFKKEKKEKK